MEGIMYAQVLHARGPGSWIICLGKEAKRERKDAKFPQSKVFIIKRKKVAP